MNQDVCIRRLEELHKEYNDLSAFYLNNFASNSSNENRFQNHDEIGGHFMSNTCPYSEEISDLNIHISKIHHELESKIIRITDLDKSLSESNNQNLELKKDIKILKDVIKRLNEQINRYQLNGKSMNGEAHPTKTSDLTSPDLRKLESLFLAYDEILMEKNNIITQASEKYTILMDKTNVINEENKSLHKYIDDNYQEGTDIHNFAQINSNARLLLEERPLIIEEIKALKQKNEDDSRRHSKDINKLKENLQKYKEKNNYLNEELTKLSNKKEKHKRECQKLLDQLDKSIPKEEHSKGVDECKRLLEKLKDSYDNETYTLKTKVKEAKTETQVMTRQIHKSTAQVKQLKKYIHGYKTSYRKTEGRVTKQEHIINEMRRSKNRLLMQLKSIAFISRNLLDDRCEILQSLKELREENQQLREYVKTRSAAVGALSVKLKEDNLMWSTKIAESEGARKAAKIAWKKTANQVSRLKSLLHTKDDTISSLLNNYRLTANDASNSKHLMNKSKYDGYS